MSSEGNNSSRFGRAQKLVESLSVKLHRFEPSRRELWTVVGKEGDLLVDYDSNGRTAPYCSCDDFHFRVLSGKVPECYHLIALRKAVDSGQYTVVEFHDEEYQSFLSALIDDLFSHVR